MSATIRPREREQILNALRAGVVPRTGLRHLQVGRAREISELISDLDLVADGGAFFRLIIGEYGAGKTFFLNLVRQIALEKKLLIMHTDLGPDRRLHATGGQARSLFADLANNMSTRARPDGGALKSMVEKFLQGAQKEAEAVQKPLREILNQKLEPLHDLVSGFDFIKVLEIYGEAFAAGDDQKGQAALQWLRAEFGTKTEARQALGVRGIIDDDGVYEHLKLYAAFARIAGYSGLLVCLDEMVNLYKLTSSKARSSNYEQLLRIVNDVLQGNIEGLGIICGGTPEFLLDTRRGLYSYEALQTRLSENPFARSGNVDLSGSVIRLQNLTAEELYVLLGNLRRIFASGEEANNLVPDEALRAFMAHCSQTIGEAYFRTPRNSVRAFVQLLSVLEQNPDASWRALVGDVEIEGDSEDMSDIDDGDELTDFRL